MAYMTKLSKLASLLCLTVMLVSAFAVVMPAQAQDDPFGIDVVGAQTGLGTGDVRETIGRIIKVALGFLGVVAVVIVLIGGFKYMIAGGSEEKVADAKKWIISGIIGLAIILSAYAITSFVMNQLITATGTDGGSSAD